MGALTADRPHREHALAVIPPALYERLTNNERLIDELIRTAQMSNEALTVKYNELRVLGTHFPEKYFVPAPTPQSSFASRRLQQFHTVTVSTGQIAQFILAPLCPAPETPH